MTPSPRYTSPRSSVRALLRLRYPLAATVAAGALVLSPLQALADDQGVPTDPATPATPAIPTATGSDPAPSGDPAETPSPTDATTQPSTQPSTPPPTQPTTQATTQSPSSDPSTDATDPLSPASDGSRPDAGLAAAAVPVACSEVYAIQGANPYNVYQVDVTNGDLSSVGQAGGSGGTSANGLGISAGAQYVYTYRGNQLKRLETATGTNTVFDGSTVSATHGAVDLSTGFYYYGTVTGTGASMWAFNTQTGTDLGKVGNVTWDHSTGTSGGANGDWAFDAQGNLYVTASGTTGSGIYEISGPLPKISGTVNLTGNRLAVIPGVSGNGIAFGGDGFLYVSDGNTLTKVNPTTGAVVGTQDQSISGTVDLASCASPSTITVRKDVVGRFNSTDQFQVQVTGAGIASNNTGTTTGTDTGAQTGAGEVAGPVLGLPGTSYDISETGVGGANLANYSTTWQCVNAANGNAVINSGTGASGSFAMPAATSGTGAGAVCTFTNTPAVTDYGDAPASYGTTTAANGPRHTLVGYSSSAHTASLMLGATVDDETNGVAGSAANGDDAAGIDDEDGLAGLSLAPGATTASATVSVVNSTGAAATLYGWIDANGNGTFQASEAATVAVPNGATSATLSWTGLTAAVDGAQPVVRLRLTSATLTDSAGTAALDERSQGAAPDGEVEDSLATVATVLPGDCSNPFVETFGAGAGRASLPGGQTTYNYAATGAVQDGSYALVPGIDTTYGSWWHTGPDHTPGDTNGRAMLVNADLNAGKFFSKSFTGLQVGGKYDFSAWITNANNAGSAILPNLKFQVVDPTTGTVLATIDTGNLANQSSLIWTRYGLSFTATQSTVRLELINNAPGGGGNDLALDDIAVAPVCEYGDAPDSYGTQRASNGPVHGVGSGLLLGSSIDYEGDGQPTATANGDDSNQVDDEDGVAAAITQTVGQATTVQVSATNSTATAATLAGWIDLNGNGTFETSERVTKPVPASSGTATYGLTFPVSPTNTDTYARFRLFPGTIAAPLPTGAATAGEVEDYPVTGTLPVVSCATDPALFNTAYDGAGNRALVGTLDRNWQVAVGNATGPASAGAYIPASVVTRNPAWYAGTFSNASWISYWPDANQVGTNVDLYFRYTFQIANEVPLDGFTLPMEFFADNSVPDVWVNGTSQDQYETGLPQAATNQYQYIGFSQANLARTSLSHGFQHGTNTIVVRVASGAPAAGFMAQINAQSLCTDRGDAPDSYGTTGVTGASHGLPGYDSSGHSSSLMLGSLIDAEADGTPGAAANGDDTAGVDDEDGVAPITVTKGAAPSITVQATNTTSGPATLAGWVDLDKSGTFDANERAVGTVAPATIDGTVTLTFAGVVTTTQATYARFRLFPGVVADPKPTGQATAGEVEDYAVTTLNPSLKVAKTSDATASSKPGDTVHYTVTLTNTGSGAFTAGNPARLVDDLTDVLDDATYQGDAAATVDGVAVGDPTYAAPRVSWSGPLAAGKSVVVTYSAVLKGGGDGHVRNTAFAPLTPTPGPTPDCSTPGPVPCDTELFELPKLSITKSANRTQLPAVGQTITYTVTVKNVGSGDFTAAHPATFADDLTAVLDDTASPAPADITASRGTATFSSPSLSWSGTLPAGQSATITYTLTYTGAGDHQLDNSACVSSAEAADPADDCRTVSVPGSGLRHHKSVDPASGTPVDEGQVLTYTLTFENVGGADATVDSSDDLTNVLDDAQIVGTPIAGSGLTVTVNGTQLDIDGIVPAGETRTVTYQVKVRAYADQGDHDLSNVLACEPTEPAGCAPETTSNPVRHLTLSKTSDATADSKPGDTVTYTVTATNDGAGDWTATDPTTIVDDLTGVLDDATYGGDATADSGADPTYTQPRITWTGALAHGDTVTVTYTVVLTGGGDGHVDNVVWQPADPGHPGPRPDCSAATVPCAEHHHDLPKLTIDKHSNRTKINADGDQIVYTVTVTNPGPGDYTAGHPATFSDDLSNVLDDAAFNTGSITQTTGTAALNGTSLDWSGVLAAGDSATVTYALTYHDARPGQNFIVNNKACVPHDEALDPADDCRTVKTPGSGLRENKSVDPASGTPVVEGQVLTYTLTFENIGAAPAAVDNSDNLTDVVDDAVLDPTIVADTGLTAVADGAGNHILVTGSVPVGETLTVTYQVQVKGYADQGNHLIKNALGCEPLDDPCVPTSTTNPVRHLTLTKTSDATANSKPGDTVSYTVRLVNDGAGDFTAADPAALVDDLAGVLDDASFNGVAHASAGPDPTYAAPRISWSGPLAAGDEVRVTYEVVLDGGGDGNVDNVAWTPTDPANPGPTPNCATATVPCAGETFDLPKLAISKSANRSQLNATGQQVTYTITVSNVGDGDYTTAHPAGFVDGLADVVDDGVVDPASVTADTGTATYAGALLTWTGSLASGDTATITYVVTYRATGNHVLNNTACVPDEEARTTAERCDSVTVNGSTLQHAKSVSPASGTPVHVGQVLTYTLSFTKTNSVPATVNTVDDLSGVLDDATLVPGSVHASLGLTATLTGTDLKVTGSLLIPATVTYQVTVKPYAAQGDHVLGNALACEPGDPTPCAPETTTNPVAHLVIDKSSDRTVDSKPGDTITYTVTATNDGTGDFTAGAPATVVDDLVGVLDDATYGNDAVAKIGATTVGAPTYAAPRVTWAGALAHGDTVTITYTAKLKGGGDGHVRNVAWQPDDPAAPGPTPDCSASPGLPCDTESFDLPKLTILKTTDKSQVTATGQHLKYTVTVTNPGPGDYTAAHPATFTDDLSQVLDDATFDAGSITASTGSASVSGNTLGWSGVLAHGTSATVTYTVTYRATGNHSLDNQACIPGDEAAPAAGSCSLSVIPGSSMTHAKTVSPASGTPVQVGQVLTYTLSFANTGTVPVDVNTFDDLSDVLDDATMVAGSVTPQAGLSATLNGNHLDVTGTVPVLATLQVTYQVKVKPYAGQANHLLANALACEAGDPAPCTSKTTSNPVAHLVIDKSSSRTVDSKPGDTITYTVTATNEGTGDFTVGAPAAVVDDLTGVLDDATYGNDAVAKIGATTVGAPTYSTPRVTWAGALAHGDTVTITYTVKLKGGGDGVVKNVAWQPDDPSVPGPTPDCSASPGVPCDTESFDLPKLVLDKSADRIDMPATGQDVTYTVVVSNPGQGDYTAGHPATFTDDLSEIRDDATLGAVTATVGSASVTGNTLSWSGVLAHGQSATITYTFTYRATGNHVLDNMACVPTDEAMTPATACDTVSVPGSGLVHSKTVDPAAGTPVQIGQTLTYTLTFDNTAGHTSATVGTSDDLSHVLDDATLDPASITAGSGLTATPTPAGTPTALDITGSVPAGQSRTVTYQVKVKPYAQQGDHLLTNALACEPGEPTPCAPATTTNSVAHLVVGKSSNRTVDSRPGDTITYTVTATNDGTGDFTGAAPATVVDDLAGVLDDATFGNDASADVGADPTYAAPRITWSGGLTHGDTVTITYTVVLTGGGDGNVDNVAWQPADPADPGPTPDCSTATVPCDTESFDLPKLTVTKTADKTQLTATGQQVTYTIVVANPGPGDYTAGHKASFSDDLSDVVDDAVVDPASVTATTGNAVYAGALLVWTGALSHGSSATINYTVTYRATGNHALDNTACVPTDEALTPADPCDSPPPIPGAHLTHTKSVDPVSGTPVQIGQVLTYTLTFANTGTVPADVNTSDDLSNVLDDAALDAASVSAGAGLTATPSGNNLNVTGTVPAGQTRTVTYQVKVKPFAAQGDHVLANALACEPGDPTPCAPETTSNPVAHLVIDKSSDRTVDSKPGDTITYTVTATNDGTGDFTAAAPATVVDDLTGVLDDAVYGNDAAADVGAGPTYAAPRITWSDALAHGDTVTITYTVKLQGGGDGLVENVAWQPDDPSVPGPTPDCSVSPGLPCDTESFDLPKLTVNKTADRIDLPATGQDVTYTVVVSNPGPGDYTAAHPATFTDDLSEVLDDATLKGAVNASLGTASITGTTLSWSGVLAHGTSATVTYTFTYRATGNHVLDNTACIPTAEAQTPAVACDTVSVPGSAMVHHKSVSPATGTPVEVGQQLTYTLTFDNTAGATAATVDSSDDLTAVLDDATLDAASITAGAGLNAGTNPAGDHLVVTGSVPAGETRDVTYQVTVKAFAQQGDHIITNALACEPGEPTPCAPETTSNPVRHVVLTKDETSPASPDTGDQVTYTVTVHNDGTGDWTVGDPASVTDDLTDVLDDATWDGTETATAGTVSYGAPTLAWSGALGHGDTVTITYSVTVTNLGDHRLANTASVVGCQLPECTPPTVVTALPHVVPDKGSSPATGTPVQPGDKVTYTLAWTNDGTAPGVVDSTDDLSGVLDDADVVTEPTSSDPAVRAIRTGTKLRVTGPIADGDTVTVDYTVRVKPAGQHGDNNLANVLAQDTPQVTCTQSCSPVPPPTVTHPVGDLDDWKTVDPASGSPVKAGNRLTYTLHFASVGTAAVTVAREDDLSGVLDDATLVGTPTSSSPALTVTGPSAGRLAVAGTLAAGMQATVTYTVKVNHDGKRGDDRLGNFLVDPGQAPPSGCAGADAHPDCTLNEVAPLEFDLKLVKKVVSSNTVEAGDSVRYKLSVSNRGPDSAPSPIVVRDPLPAGLELVSAHGKGWDCTATQATDLVVCRLDKDLAAHHKAYPILVVAKTTASASGRIVNIAKVKAHGDVSPSNNRGVAPLTVSAPAALPDTGFRFGALGTLGLRW